MGGKGRDRRARNKVLRLQLGNLGAHLVGIQEARNPVWPRAADDFWITSSGTTTAQDDTGGQGVELWINRKLPYAKVGPRELCFGKSHFKALFSSPRALFVCLSAPSLSITVAVLHAPHTKRPPEERKTFWEAVRPLCERWSPQIILTDANAKLGSVVSDVVGGFGFSQQQDSNGQELHDLASASGLPIVNTLVPDPESGHTFTELGGSQHRIDYVLTDFYMLDKVSECRVLYSFDNVMSCRDHHPLLVSFSWACSPFEVSIGRCAKLDPRRLASPSDVAEFQSLLDDKLWSPWSVDMNVHLDSLSTQVFDAAASCVAYAIKTPSKPYVSSPALC